MRERSGVITLSDVSFELIEQFVEFLYSGTIQNFELVEDLFVFSDEYHILPLKVEFLLLEHLNAFFRISVPNT
jgi:hypothetical protein